MGRGLACTVLLLAFGASPALVGAADDTVRTAPADEEAFRRTAPHSGDVLKLRGDFGGGLYVGRVKSIEPSGLAGFTDDPQWHTDLPKPAEPLTWDRITSVERRDTHAPEGAIVGAALLALPTAVYFGLGPAFENDLGSSEVLVPALEGAVVGAGLGAVLGLAVGSAFRCWRVVYRRP